MTYESAIKRVENGKVILVSVAVCNDCGAYADLFEDGDHDPIVHKTSCQVVQKALAEVAYNL